jgi:hypothetical protein
VVEGYHRTKLTSIEERLVLYHGTNLKVAPVLREGSYLTTDFWIAASYGLDKTDSKECYVYEYIVIQDLITIPGHWRQELRVTPRYNVEMGHDSYQNNEPLKPSGKHWHFKLTSGTTKGPFSNGWDDYEITPRPPQPRHSHTARVAVIRKEKGEYCVRSPNNPDWNGGCYTTKDKAEDRLKEVELFKHNKSAEVIAMRVARLFVAGLSQELEKRVEDLLQGPYERSKAYDLADWLKQNFKVGVSVRGHRGMADSLDRFMGILNQSRNEHGWNLSPDSDKMTQVVVKTLWERDLKPKMDELIQYFTDEGGSKLVAEYKLGSDIYLNKVGMSEDNLIKYATRLDSLFNGLSGWRKKALSGGLTVALAPPKNFRGTSSGRYSASEDTLYVRAIPKVLQRSGGTYGSVDYILIHELGHRYEKLHKLPVDFDKPEWWTSKYSRTESMSGSSESFAELFAIGQFNLTGPWDQSKVERFEKLMG